MAVKAKRTEYAITLDREGRLCLPGRQPVHFPPEWSAEHLLLAALARCALAALAYHARRDELWVSANADASGAITRRADGSFGFVEIECAVEVRADPKLDDERLADILARAEAGCFIGQSLDPRPTYRWTVNGEPVTARAAPS